MNIFLKNTVLFSCFILAFFSINCIVNLYLISNAKINLDNKNIIAIGDSHFENGLIEDSLTACVSFAKNSDSYELMYYKLKTAINQKNDISTILLSVSYNNWSAFYDDYYYLDKWNPEHQLTQLYPYINPIKLITGSRKTNIKAYFAIIVKNMLLHPTRKHIQYGGFGYFKRDYSNLRNSKPDESIKRHFYSSDSNKTIGFSNIQSIFFRKIITLCSKHNLNLKLIFTPLHKDYKNAVPQEYIEQMNSEISVALKQKHVVFWDFSELNLEDHYFIDHDHLNYEGAKLFTHLIEKKLTYTN